MQHAMNSPVPELETIIDIRDVSMRFQMPNDRITSIKEYILNRIQGKVHYKEFEALKHVSFSAQKGDVVGLVGKNGAGKSTMLKIISGIYKPSDGRVEIHGNVAPMLELGSGFDMDMTGEENIFLNGAILGYSKAFLEQKYADIVSFSEIKDFIHIPLRNYSSGMIARLAFSIASVIEPEILIVDEVLAVGDASFQKKSLARMTELMSGGTTVLFVSHKLSQVRSLCNKVVWLDNGSVRMVGDTETVCSAYENNLLTEYF